VRGLAKGWRMSGAHVGTHLGPPDPQEVVGLGEEGGRDGAGEAPYGAVGDVRAVPAPSIARGQRQGASHEGEKNAEFTHVRVPLATMATMNNAILNRSTPSATARGNSASLVNFFPVDFVSSAMRQARVLLL